MKRESFPMNILLCLDDISGEYSRHAMVTLLSLFETNSKHRFHIYILSSQISEENRQEIKNIVDKHGSNVFFIIAQDIIQADIKNELIFSRHELTYATFYRLFFCEHIDASNIERILYLDCDTIVTKDIKGTYEQDMGNNIIAGASDIPWMEYQKKKIFGLKKYINAGVLLIDVQKYKQIDLKRSIHGINKQYRDMIKNDDQDYINLIFRDTIHINSHKQINHIIDRKFLVFYENSTILHLTNKPSLSSMPLPQKIRNLYDYYLQKTSFRNHNIEKKYFDFGIAWYSTMRSILIVCTGSLLGGFGAYWAWKITKGPVNLYTKILGK